MSDHRAPSSGGYDSTQDRRFLADKFKQRIRLRTDRLALQRLKEAAEKAKIELSSAATTEINQPFITARMEGGSTTPLHLVETITRADLEKLVQPLIDRTLDPCKKALKDAGIKPADIADVVLVGGMTRMPRVREVVKDFCRSRTPRQTDEVFRHGRPTRPAFSGDVKDVWARCYAAVLGIETWRSRPGDRPNRPSLPESKRSRRDDNQMR